MKKYIKAVGFAALVGATCLPLACSSKGPTFGQDDGSGDDATASDSSSSSSGSSSSGGVSSGSSGSSSGGFMHGDSGGMGNGVCQTGTYSGSFSCGFIYDQDAGDASAGGGGDAAPLITIMGNLSFVLTQSLSGELGKDTASGTFVLNAGLTTGMATLSGSLDCATGVFTGALSGGMYSLLGIFTGPFEGPLTSDYNGVAASFVDGVWALTVPGYGYCPGQWTANFSGASDAGGQ